jgi:hypothetical protein
MTAETTTAMSRENLVDRVDQLKIQLDQALATCHALSGAIQECEFWLARIDQGRESRDGADAK